MKRAVAGLAAAAAASFVLVSGCGSEPPPEDPSAEALVFASVPSEQHGELLEFFQPILKMLRAETGREIRVLDAPDYKAVIEGVRAGEIDIADLGPFAYVQAEEQGAPITVVAARVNDTDAEGLPIYRSYGITRADSSIKSLAEFSGKKICFVDPGSASGYLYPKKGLLDEGISLDQGDVEKEFAGSHDASVLAVADGRCDAGFAWHTIVERRLPEQGRIQPGDIAVVWESEDIPGGAFVVSDRLPEELRQKLVTALQEKGDADSLREDGHCEGKCVVADGYGYGFAPVDDSFYDSVRDVCRTTGEDICTGG